MCGKSVSPFLKITCKNAQDHESQAYKFFYGWKPSKQ